MVDATQPALFGERVIAYCNRCGKALTNPASIAAHIGPICRGRIRGDKMHTEDLTDFRLDIPLEQGIVLRRVGETVYTNVPHLVTHHSPTGFEFGYGGSGPADLALNIVEAILKASGYQGERMKCYDGNCFKKAFELHQMFKREFIAGIDRDNGGEIPYSVAEKWVTDRIVVEEGLPRLPLF